MNLKFFHYSNSLKKILYCGYKDLIMIRIIINEELNYKIWGTGFFIIRFIPLLIRGSFFFKKL